MPLNSSGMIGLQETPEGKNKALFLDCLQLIERLHRRMLDVIKAELESKGIAELNAVQALLLYNIGDNKLTAGELRTRGYYLGSNVSYNLKQLVDLGYIIYERAPHDKRAVRISLSDNGKKVRTIIDGMYDSQLNELLGDDLLNIEAFRTLRKSLRNLERFWTDNLHFAP